MSASPHLSARPALRPALGIAPPSGLFRIEVGAERPVWARVGRDVDRPLPFALMLHGAGGRPEDALRLLEPFAAESGVAVVAPASTDTTWDAVLHRPGPDLAIIDRALSWIFERYAIDGRRLAVGGFSDGASYALSLGVDNGDLFSHVLALSPGFVAPTSPRGGARFFISHGTRDTVLPIVHCSRRIVPTLRKAGRPVEYHEFDGGHEIPERIARLAVDFLMS
ncbi:MAG TPA: alpha/beta hydrolase-fold protein [Caldimonas sp.]|nr:alpha/beta hydrolase-fold protein [Caldimonas sp.]HEX2540009.1 alpha/beta hydrolase-fold protein [Caldimonas sp.]